MWYGSTRENIRLVKLDLFITSRCNLRCRRCSNLIQYYDNPNDESIEDIKHGLQRAFELIDFTESLFILGGEPFLHPHLGVILSEAAKYREYTGNIVVISNGLVMAEQSAAEALRTHSIPVNISSYKSFTRVQEQTARDLERSGIEVELFDPQWTARTQREDNNGTIFYTHCRHMNAPCVTLRGTQLWYCEFAANAHALGCAGRYIDLSGSVSKEDLYEYLDPYAPLTACKYCSGAFSDICLEAGAEQCPVPLGWQT